VTRFGGLSKGDGEGGSPSCQDIYARECKDVEVHRSSVDLLSGYLQFLCRIFRVAINDSKGDQGPDLWGSPACVFSGALGPVGSRV